MPDRLLLMGKRLLGGIVGELANISARAKPLKRARTLGEFWTLHHLPLLESTGRPNTLRQYRHRWDYWIAPTFGHLRWAELDKRRVAAFVISLRRQHCNKDERRELLSSGTVINVFAVLSSALTHAVDLDYLESNPASAAARYLPKLEPAKRNQGKIRALTLDQARELLTCREISIAQRAEIALEIYTGARRGEAHGLRWWSLHLGSAPPWLRIEKSYSGPPKRGIREVPVHPELAIILGRWRAAWERRYGRAPMGEDLVFPREDDAQRLQCSRDVDPMRRACRAADVPAIGHHGLRHTCGTLYRAAGLKREDIAALLGHGADRDHKRTRSRAETQTDLYAPPTMALLAQEVARLRLLTAQDLERASSAREKKVDGCDENRLPLDPCRAGASPVQSNGAKSHDDQTERKGTMQHRAAGITMVLPPEPDQGSAWDDFGFPVAGRYYGERDR